MIFIYVRVHTCKSMPTESRRGPQILYRSQPAQVSTGNQAGSGEEYQAFLTAEPLLSFSSSLHLFTHLFSLSQTLSLCEHACTYSWAYTDQRMASINLFSFPTMKVPGIKLRTSGLAGLSRLSGPVVVLLFVIAVCCFMIDSAHFIFLRTAVTEPVVWWLRLLKFRLFLLCFKH